MSSSLNILCIDSSTEACSVALSTSDTTTHHFMLAPREHTQKILPTVNDVVKQANLTLADIDVIAYGQGPGSFTGVRIGISIAQGLAYGLEKKMVGVSTLQAMAQQALVNDPTCNNVYAAIDARMGEVYFAQYCKQDGVMTLQEKEVVIKPETLIETYQTQGLSVQKASTLVGTGWVAYPELLTFFEGCQQTEILYPDAQFMLKAATLLINDNQAVEPESATPVYLRDTVTWKKLPGRE
ncbi:tRNA (adenosine(37)-N6)-threonylcarbamoyltransferase complex dimerization subunit type 1 TsaB [Psychromonas sp. 14N.309.X.WAT.B.A12]|uniref:tRNA (adenosine(37)-N6)-threonylcarbamoyltransferase complex dimerization subunit type 1 TsaB n=1 Tax=Psychromonas sp. 14N.309.X.WAT.B.A12 TaxID=2998322 RepID=UPI0025B10DDB|nr:tRNA (adenosine(37)-N6)-threonylcarbamoyltransferase complex dimerization subunit type 1 TsaB [Psychromonas sp. 14N.309.X.WAT.B.A12]MDN2662205.1 tRNA (adenosine(37)-N6)-threonylcarbamoyltransferase complex dimerization subunit type 1 TsaB [Psychromonas sp. 14N.309.X.WAT.B.A12]